MNLRYRCIALGILLMMAIQLQSDPYKLTEEEAYRFSLLALKGIQREFPNKLDHIMNDVSEVQRPSAIHPAFYGCFDWHSSVHGHWMLIALLRMFPKIRNAQEIRSALNHNLTQENIQKEVAYLKQPNRKSFERTYGWAWALKLAEVLYGWEDVDGKRWCSHLEPLANAMVLRYLDFLPRQTYPIRTGVHPNTAFGLTFALDYARKVGHKELEKLVVEKSVAYFIQGRRCCSIRGH
jgi:hypothetical protein